MRPCRAPRYILSLGGSHGTKKSTPAKLDDRPNELSDGEARHSALMVWMHEPVDISCMSVDMSVDMSSILSYRMKRVFQTTSMNIPNSLYNIAFRIPCSIPTLYCHSLIRQTLSNTLFHLTSSPDSETTVFPCI